MEYIEVISLLLGIIPGQHVEKSRLPFLIQHNTGRHARTPPLRVPNQTILIGIIHVDRRLHRFALKVHDVSGSQINLKVIEIVFPILPRLLPVARIVESIRHGSVRIFKFAVVINDERDV